MPDQDVKLPLSGDVTQTFFPWTTNFTVNVGRSSDPAMETDALSVASYGRQLGRIGDALIVLLKHVELANLSASEEKVILDLKYMLHAIDSKKERRRAQSMVEPSPDYTLSLVDIRR